MPHSRSHWRHGNGTDWPTEWPSRAEKWPKFRTEPWTPERAGKALIVCLREREANMFTEWADAAEAEIADLDFYVTPCSPGCQGRHVRIWATEGKLHIVPGFHDKPPVPTDLGRALRAAGYHRCNGSMIPPENWPHPSCWNPPMYGGHQ